MPSQISFRIFQYIYSFISASSFFDRCYFWCQCSVIPTSQRQPSTLYPGGPRDRYRPVQKLLATQIIQLWTQRLVFLSFSLKVFILPPQLSGFLTAAHEPRPDLQFDGWLCDYPGQAHSFSALIKILSHAPLSNEMKWDQIPVRALDNAQEEKAGTSPVRTTTVTSGSVTFSGIESCPMILVFGCRQSEMDHIYKEETIQAKNKGAFKELYTAYSREPGKPKVQSTNVSVSADESVHHNSLWTAVWVWNKTREERKSQIKAAVVIGSGVHSLQFTSFVSTLRLSTAVLQITFLLCEVCALLTFMTLLLHLLGAVLCAGFVPAHTDAL